MPELFSGTDPLLFPGIEAPFTGLIVLSPGIGMIQHCCVGQGCVLVQVEDGYGVAAYSYSGGAVSTGLRLLSWPLTLQATGEDEYYQMGCVPGVPVDLISNAPVSGICERCKDYGLAVEGDIDLATIFESAIATNPVRALKEQLATQAAEAAAAIAEAEAQAQAAQAAQALAEMERDACLEEIEALEPTPDEEIAAQLNERLRELMPSPAPAPMLTAVEHPPSLGLFDCDAPPVVAPVAPVAYPSNVVPISAAKGRSKPPCVTQEEPERSPVVTVSEAIDKLLEAAVPATPTLPAPPAEDDPGDDNPEDIPPIAEAIKDQCAKTIPKFPEST